MAEDHFGIVGSTQAGAYRVEAVVAEGGFAVVYRAYHDAFQAPVALKCLKIPQQLTAEHQADFLAKFREEAALLFRLSASMPAVVRPLHVDQLAVPDGRFVPFMALEWLDGEGLDALIARRAESGKPPLSVRRVIRLLTPVARALARAHHFPTPDGAIAIVHRDLKPDNIFIARVNGEEVVKIFDFGIAKVRGVAEQVAGRMSQSGQMSAFTPGYGAPEQWLPKRWGQTGPWTDVFGLALTVLEAAAGRPIIDGDTAAMMGTACDEQRRPTPRNEGLEVSDEVEQVFAAALAVDPRKRYPDAGSFWDALESAAGLEVSATPTIAGSRRDARLEGGIGPSEHSSVAPAPRSVRPSAPQQAPTQDAGSLLPRAAPAPTPPPILVPDIPDIDLSVPQPPPKAAAAATPGPTPPGPAAAAQPTPAPRKPVVLDDDEPLDLALDIKDGAGKELPAKLRASAMSGGMSAPPSARGAPQPGVPAAAVTTGSFAKPPAPLPRSPPPPTAFARLKVPLGVGGAGLLLIVVEQVFDHVYHSLLELGGVRLTWVAGLLLAASVVWTMKVLIFSQDG